jgi:formate hydrogenlyase subunit 3/multisubunit Na+/H+ antiporter MnhD subunit
VVHQHHRATSAAALLLILSLIGLSLGPTFVGAPSELLAIHQHLGKAAGLRWAMIVIAFVCLISVLLLVFARRTVRQDGVS